MYFFFFTLRIFLTQLIFISGLIKDYLLVLDFYILEVFLFLRIALLMPFEDMSFQLVWPVKCWETNLALEYSFICMSSHVIHHISLRVGCCSAGTYCAFVKPGLCMCHGMPVHVSEVNCLMFASLSWNRAFPLTEIDRFFFVDQYVVIIFSGHNYLFYINIIILIITE